MVMKEKPGNGLDIVELRDHDPFWKVLFQRERDSLAETLGPLARSIEHVGSTAVPGIRAKPVIDILVTVDDLRPGNVEMGLARLDYVHVDIGDPERLFFRKGMPRTYHVHVVRHGGEEHWKHLLFRDRLIAHPEEAQEYERLKVSLAMRFRQDREAYSKGKDDFISMILERAEVERGRLV
ncbi:MAG: dephospho-CoA kinase/protein folding accessory domain-containing protein [Methanomassiliicoccales archaeon PtaB.Bin215]|nr:MAG: dephospho-CoA kinase/protein folding accessory domain-containing protein [Methanomassiliicoccales archaeon PtaB.Bin215]